MIAALGIPRTAVMGGGDCRTLLPATKLFRSSDVASGDNCPPRGCADGARRCFVRYDAERGNAGRVLVFGG